MVVKNYQLPETNGRYRSYCQNRQNGCNGYKIQWPGYIWLNAKTRIIRTLSFRFVFGSKLIRTYFNHVCGIVELTTPLCTPRVRRTRRTTKCEYAFKTFYSSDRHAVLIGKTAHSRTHKPCETFKQTRK